MLNLPINFGLPSGVRSNFDEFVPRDKIHVNYLNVILIEKGRIRYKRNRL